MCEKGAGDGGGEVEREGLVRVKGEGEGWARVSKNDLQVSMSMVDLLASNLPPRPASLPPSRSSLEVQLYPAAVEQWVSRHQHDISRDERWRTKIAQQIADLDSNIRRVVASQQELTPTDNETDGEMARRYNGVRRTLVMGRNSEAMNAPVSSFGSSSSDNEPIWRAARTTTTDGSNGGAADNVSVAHLQTDMSRLLARMASQETLLQQLTSPVSSKGTPGTSKGKPRWTDA